MAEMSALESELEATRMLIEQSGVKAMVLGIQSNHPDEPHAVGAGNMARAVSEGTTRRDAEVFIHALRREADRLERLIGGLRTTVEDR